MPSVEYQPKNISFQIMASCTVGLYKQTADHCYVVFVVIVSKNSKPIEMEWNVLDLCYFI